MTSYSVTLTQAMTAHEAPSPTTYYKTWLVSDAFRFLFGAPHANYGVTLTQAMHIHLAANSYQWQAGGILVEHIKLHPSDSERMVYHTTLSQLTKIASAFLRATPVTLTQAMTVHQAQAAALGVIVLGRVKMADAPSPVTKYHIALAQACLFHPVLQAFFGKTLTEALHIHPAQSVSYHAVATLAQTVAISSVLSRTIVFNMTVADEVEIGPTQLLRMIFAGTLSDIIDLGVLYVSPGGGTTTWAINTRTNAITEYQNWSFNSFAQMGTKYIAANATGLYELDGASDPTQPVSALFRTGYAQMNGGRLAGLSGLYLGMRGEGEFFIKLLAGDGREYVYALETEPNVMTTKVQTGKGLRSRYFAFEFSSPGPDFDIDTIEFVPMLSQRRV